MKMAYYHHINSFSIIKNEIIYLTKKTWTCLSFLLFEIFELEILTTYYASPVIVTSNHAYKLTIIINRFESTISIYLNEK